MYDCTEAVIRKNQYSQTRTASGMKTPFDFQRAEEPAAYRIQK